MTTWLTGTTCISRSSPRSSSAVRRSGDVNQGREMKILARELDALDSSVLSFHRVAEDVAPCDPEGVRRVLEPLPIEGPEPGIPRSPSSLRRALWSRQWS
jgi:hypothetical protein